MRRIGIKKILLAFIILISCMGTCKAQDQIVNGRNVNFPVSLNTVWSSLSNQTYVFTPLNPDYGFCVSVVNNNTTSGHTFTLQAFQTSDLNASDYSHNTSRYNTLSIIGNISPIAAGSSNTVFIKGTGASKIAFKFTGGSTQAGSPDTADIYAVQTTSGSCGSVLSSNPYTTSVSELLAQSFSSSTAYYFNVLPVTNPGTNNIYLSLTSTVNSKALLLDKIYVSSTVNIQINLGGFTTAATTCTAQTATTTNYSTSPPITSTATLGTGCTGFGTGPIGNNLFLLVPANTTTVLDLTGFIATNGNNLTIYSPTAATGVVQTTLVWHER